MRTYRDYSPIAVRVKSFYLREQSDPEANRFVFAYTVDIKNNGDFPARLIGRHWVITDAHGRKQEVQGPGVIGEQPSIQPGENYQYTSGAILETPVGTMHGIYHMLTESGEPFNADIAPFCLANPALLN